MTDHTMRMIPDQTEENTFFHYQGFQEYCHSTREETGLIIQRKLRRKKVSKKLRKKMQRTRNPKAATDKNQM